MNNNAVPDKHFQQAQALATRIEFNTSTGKQIWHVWNEQAKRPLILLHGGSGSWTHWVRNVLPLSQDRAVWAVDLPGFGDSQVPPEAKDVDDIFSSVSQSIAELHPLQSVDVMGFSFGGLLASYIAAHHPHIIQQLVLVGVPGLGMNKNRLVIKSVNTSITKQERFAVHQNNLLVLMLHSEHSIDEETLQIQDDNILRDRLKKRRIAKTEIVRELQKLWTCPVHAIWGEHDAYYKDMLDQAADRLKDCDLKSNTIIKHAGHWVQYESAQEFNETVKRYLG
ncbi:MAG: alpha/beta hydrolase [Limnohabitans sp.]|nr:alpha/beta hydrolase [Limnohabitans sp.]